MDRMISQVMCTNCRLLQQELDLTRRLVEAEQHSSHMKSDLIHIYDQLLTTLDVDMTSVMEKTIDVVKHENRLKKLRNEVKEWRKLNKPLSTSSSDLLTFLNLLFHFRPTIDFSEEGTD